MGYLLDTNVFIAAKDSYYRPQVFPGFWEWLKLANDQDTVYSVAAVLEELQDRVDELAKWARGLKKSMFLEPDRWVNKAHSELREWTLHKNQYRSEAGRTMT